MKINKNEIGVGCAERLRTLRIKLNLTPNQMAARLDVKTGTYYKYESGETKPGWTTLFILQKDYKISVDWLMLNKEPMYINEKVPHMSQIQAERQKEKQTLENTTKQLNQLKEETKHFCALKKMLPDVEPLLETMTNDPELRHEILLKYHRHLKEHASTGTRRSAYKELD